MVDNKTQYKYQPKPNTNGQKCIMCKLFIHGRGCQIVTGAFTTEGWCTLWDKKI